MQNKKNLEVLKVILELSQNADLKVFVVGGAVRDLILLKQSAEANAISGEQNIIPKINLPDIDLLMNSDIYKFSEVLEETKVCKVKVHKQFLTAKLEFSDGLSFDLVQTRSESYLSSGSLPIVKVGDFEADTKRRDFTVNTLKLSLEDYLDCVVQDFSLTKVRAAVIDQAQGLEDLEQGLIRTLHAESFRDDPTRIFRALRYKGRLNGQLEEQTQAQLHLAIQDQYLNNISEVRVLNELIKIIAEPSFEKIKNDFEIFSLAINQIFSAKDLEVLQLERSLNQSNQVLSRDDTMILLLDALGIEKAESIFVRMQIAKELRKKLIAIHKQAQGSGQ
jgi:tRNA nucleotidyltransferase/poly(A) polymerase